MTGASATLHGLPATALIPLYFRAVESRDARPLLVDPTAVALVERLVYDFSTIDVQGPDRLFVMMRARQFDRYARVFIEEHPDAVVVDLGCGLDTRFARLDNGLIDWCGVDLPEMIEWRRALLGDAARGHLVPCSLLEPRWMDLLPAGRRPTLFLAEGVFMYLEGQQVKTVVTALARKFPGSELVFDAMSPLFMWLHNRQAILKRLDVRLKWGLGSVTEPEAWAPNMRLRDCWSYFDDREPRLGRLAWLRHVPGARKGNIIVRYEIGRHPSQELLR